MPTVKWRFGRSLASSSNTGLIIPGVTSLEARPYRPPITRGIAANGGSSLSIRSAIAVTIAWYRGSPTAPGSFVRSRTAIARTVDGRAAMTWSTGNGWNRRISRTPVCAPAAFSVSTVSSTAPMAEPMTTTTRSASAAPW